MRLILQRASEEEAEKRPLNLMTKMTGILEAEVLAECQRQKPDLCELRPEWAVKKWKQKHGLTLLIGPVRRHGRLSTDFTETSASSPNFIKMRVVEFF